MATKCGRKKGVPQCECLFYSSQAVFGVRECLVNVDMNLRGGRVGVIRVVVKYILDGRTCCVQVFCLFGACLLVVKAVW